MFALFGWIKHLQKKLKTPRLFDSEHSSLFPLRPIKLSELISLKKEVVGPLFGSRRYPWDAKYSVATEGFYIRIVTNGQCIIH